MTHSRVFVIAEAGVNHNGRLDLAEQLVDAAAACGADAVKFQSFRAAQLAGADAPKAEYQAQATGAGESQLEMLRRLEISEAVHHALVSRARARGIAFLSSPFDESSLQLLTQRLGVSTIKIPSGELTNAPFLLAIGRAAQRVICSTGMATLAEVEQALGVLAYAFSAAAGASPASGDFERALLSDAGRLALRDRVTLLHCTTEYPAPPADVNLRAMDALREAFGLPVGYSDHTEGIHVSVAAVARGAQVIEKHFTLDRSLPGPDHAASLEPADFAQLVRQIREIERALGDGVKHPAASELANRDIVRRRLVARRPIRRGEVLSEANLACKRPGAGLSPFEYWNQIGKPASRDYAADDPIDG